MKFLKAYRYPLTVTFALIAICFIFQNGTCSPTSTTQSAVNNSTATATATPASLTLSPSVGNVGYGSTLYFIASGGTPPYTYLDLSGSNYINANTGAYTTPSSASTATTQVGIEVYDSSSPRKYAYATVNVGPSLSTASATPTPAIGTASILSVYTNSQQPNEWSVNNLMVNNPNLPESQTCYSSKIFNTPLPSTPPSVEMYLGVNGVAQAVTVDHLNIRSRTWTTNYVTSKVSFPTVYRISAKNLNNAGYTTVGTFTTQPGTDFVAVATFTAVTTTQLVFTATSLGLDPNHDYYLQFCGLSF